MVASKFEPKTPSHTQPEHFARSRHKPKRQSGDPSAASSSVGAAELIKSEKPTVILYTRSYFPPREAEQSSSPSFQLPCLTDRVWWTFVNVLEAGIQAPQATL